MAEHKRHKDVPKERFLAGTPQLRHLQLFQSCFK